MTPPLHPRNRDFEWQAAVAPFSLVSEAQARDYDEKGYFLLQNVFTPAEIAEVTAAIDPFEQAGEQALREMHGGQYLIAKADAITFTAHLVSKSAVLQAFSRHPVLAQLCRDLIGPSPRLYWDQAVYKKPGNPEEFPWHQDNGYTYIEPQQYLTCWVPLTDATVDNGCPWVVPGLHRLGTIEHRFNPLGWQCLEASENAEPIEAREGDVVVFSSLTPHRTGPNLTDAVRKSYILQYAPDGALAYPHGSAEPVRQDDPVRQYLV